MKGFVQKDDAFTGHSLGEYSALASIADVLHISALVGVVFHHGITMQLAVERDSENRSNYGVRLTLAIFCLPSVMLPFSRSSLAL